MTDIEVLFKQFLRTSPLAIGTLVTMDSAVAPQWLEVFKAGYQAAMENVGDLILADPAKKPVPTKKPIGKKQ